MTPTQRAYKAINQSYDARHRLRIAAVDGNGEYTHANSFNAAIIGLCEELDYKDSIHIASLSSNMWRYGAWRRKQIQVVNTENVYTKDTKRVFNTLIKDPTFAMQIKNTVRAELSLEKVVAHMLHDIKAPAIYRNELSKLLYNWATKEEHEEQNTSSEHGMTNSMCYACTEKYELTGTPEKYPMEIKVQTLINGVPLEEMDDSQLIHHITNLEDKIEKRSKIRTKSAKITAEIELMKGQCIQLAAFLDAKE